MLHEHGIPSSDCSRSNGELVPVACAHRPSLSQMAGWTRSFGCEYTKLDKMQVVARLRSVNQPQDHLIHLYRVYFIF